MPRLRGSRVASVEDLDRKIVALL
ncbi:MAG: hypothetical protein QOG10_2563, partial [Kribbellaceae bacterium]|nr:hypothetical protein [Kribbellaceae bacterium]